MIVYYNQFWVLIIAWLSWILTIALLSWISAMAWLSHFNNMHDCIMQFFSFNNRCAHIEFHITMNGALTWQVHEKHFTCVSEICGSIWDQRDKANVFDCSFAVTWLSTANELQPNWVNLDTGSCWNFKVTWIKFQVRCVSIVSLHVMGYYMWK